MATYLEIYELMNNEDLRRKVEISLLVTAQVILDKASPTAQELNWARMVMVSSASEAHRVLKYLLAKNNTAELSAITGATDATIQALVTAISTNLVAGG